MKNYLPRNAFCEQTGPRDQKIKNKTAKNKMFFVERKNKMTISRNTKINGLAMLVGAAIVISVHNDDMKYYIARSQPAEATAGYLLWGSLGAALGYVTRKGVQASQA